MNVPRKLLAVLTALCVLTAGGMAAVGAKDVPTSEDTDDETDTNGDLFPNPIEISFAGIAVTFGPPQDLDGDGLYEDVTGDDTFNIADVFAHGIVVTAVDTGLVDLSDEQAGAVDVNDDDEVTYDDTYKLYQLISGELPEVPDMGDDNGADNAADDADNGDDTTTETPSDENDSDSDENETETPDDGASTYYFQVERADDAGDEPNEQYEFTVTSNNGSSDDTSIDKGEPNNEPADATEINLGGTVSGVVNDSDDDWYAIELEDGQSITVNGTDFASDTVITAYGPTNTDDVSEDDLEAIGSGNFTIVEKTLIEFETGSTPDE